MNKEIKISVIIACYNVEKYLVQCLDSVINQTFENLEIIVVNDGSKDATLTILQEYQSRDKRIIIINQQNQGLSGARNSGIKIATGQYLMFIDSDDWIDLETLTLCNASLKENITNLVFFSYTKEYQNKSIDKYILPKNHFYNSTEIKILHKRIFGLSGEQLAQPEHADSIVTAWGKLYNTAIIQENNLKFVDCKIIGTEDMLFNVYYFNYIQSANYINKCLYHYRKNNNSSLTSTYKNKLKQQWTNLYGFVQEFINKHQLDNTYQLAFNNRISMSIISLGLNELHSDNGFLNQIKKIKLIINNPDYKSAIKTFEIEYLPLHWRIFFLFVKNNITFGVFIMLKIIKTIIEKNN